MIIDSPYYRTSKFLNIKNELNYIAFNFLISTKDGYAGRLSCCFGLEAFPAGYKEDVIETFASWP